MSLSFLDKNKSINSNSPFLLTFPKLRKRDFSRMQTFDLYNLTSFPNLKTNVLLLRLYSRTLILSNFKTQCEVTRTLSQYIRHTNLQYIFCFSLNEIDKRLE